MPAFDRLALLPPSTRTDASAVTAVAAAGTSGTAQPLPYQQEMEAAFGFSFAAVRVHSDAAAAKASKDLGAEAYTYGSHIVSARPQLSRQVVAHELSHVVQQAAGVGPPSGLGRRGDAFEHEAHTAAAAALAQKPTGLGQRYPSAAISAAMPGRAVQLYEPSAGVPSSSSNASAAALDPPHKEWAAPFGIGSLQTIGEAFIGLDRMQSQLRELSSDVGDGDGRIGKVDQGIRAMMKVLATRSSASVTSAVVSPDLTPAEVAQLEVLGDQAQQVTAAVTKQSTAVVKQSATKIINNSDTTKLSEVQEQIADQLQSDFEFDRQDPDLKDKLRKGLLKTFLVELKVNKVIKWADELRHDIDERYDLLNYDPHKRVGKWSGPRQTAMVLPSGKVGYGVIDRRYPGLVVTAQHVAESSAPVLEGLRSWAGKIADGTVKMLQVAEAYSGLATLFSSRTAALPGPAAELKRFRAGLDLLDAAAPFVKSLPLLSDLWFDQYSPITRKSIELIEGMYRFRRLQEHQLANNIDTFEAPQTPGDAPRIPKENLHLFPGGQPVFDCMYALLNAQEPVLTPAVEQFFLAAADRLNVGLDGKEQLKSKSQVRLLSPSTYRKPRTLPDLAAWLEANKEIVWAQLYGSLSTRPAVGR